MNQPESDLPFRDLNDRYIVEKSFGETRGGWPCHNCGKPGFKHEKERVYPDDGPAGSYHYEYYCPGE